MYLPTRFEVNDNRAIGALINRHPLATVMTASRQQLPREEAAQGAETGANLPFVGHLPLIARSGTGGEVKTLAGHMARANPQWRFLNGQPVYVIFHGPDAYVTPLWYEKNDVPTWNYATVHVTGIARLVEDADGITQLLQEMNERFEGSHPESKGRWEFWLPPDLARPSSLQGAIVGIIIEVESVRAKFKLSQNRSEPDRLAVAEGLEKVGTDKCRSLAGMMREGFSGKGR